MLILQKFKFDGKPRESFNWKYLQLYENVFVNHIHVTLDRLFFMGLKL